MLSQLTTHLPFQRGRHHGRTAGGLSGGDIAIQERDDLVGQPNGDLRTHDPMIPNCIPKWDASQPGIWRTGTWVAETCAGGRGTSANNGSAPAELRLSERPARTVPSALRTHT